MTFVLFYCAVSQNYNQKETGSLAIKFTNKVIVMGSKFVGNSGERGAGIFVFQCKTALLYRCYMERNAAVSQGGILFIEEIEDCTFIDTYFLKNNAIKGGSIHILNCRFCKIFSCLLF